MSRVVQSGNSVSGMTIQELKRALGLEFVVDFDTRPKGGGKSRGGNGQMTGVIILLIILLTILLIILMIIILIILLIILQITPDHTADPNEAIDMSQYFHQYLIEFILTS